MAASLVPVLLIHILAFSCNATRFLHDRHAYFSDINVNVSWSIIEKTQTIYIEIIAPVSDETAWFAFGMSENSGMKGADIALISLYHEKVFDLHSDDFVLPKMDKIQDWKLESLHINRENGISIAQISRHLLTCDFEDFRIKTNPFHQYILIAYNEHDSYLESTTNMKLSISIHTRKETKEVNLFIDEDLLINDVTTSAGSFGGDNSNNNTNNSNTNNIIEFLTNNGTIDVVKSAGTQYLCTMFNLTQEYNVTNVEIIDENGRNLVHHATLFNCDASHLAEGRVTWNTNAVECGAGDGYEMTCPLTFVLAGSTSINLPSTMYYNLQPGIYILEVHYDLLDDYNNGQNYIFQDNASGMRVYTTGENNDNNDRQNEVSILRMLVDENYNYFIPPNKKLYEIAFAMHSSCINYYFPDDGIDMILIGGHMHYTGAKVRVDRIRYGGGGKNNEIVTIFELNHWDFDRQFAHRVNYHINKNDTIRVHCFFDTTHIDENIHFGWKTSDEMCHVYLGYTPKIHNLTTVLSTPIHSGNLDPCYCGDLQINGWNEVESLGLNSFVFENTHNIGVNSVNNGLNTEKMDETEKFCEELVFSEVDLTRTKLIWRTNQNFMCLIPAVLIALSIFVCFAIIEFCIVKCKIIDDIHRLDVGVKRKITIYIFSIVFYTIMLSLLLASLGSDIMDLSKTECDLSYHERIDEDLIDNTYMLAVSNCLIIFYVCELYYRQQVRWDLFLHHLFTIAVVSILQTAVQYTLNVKTIFVMAYCYLLQIGTEQPLFIALLLRRLPLVSISQKHDALLFYFASIWHFITKIATTFGIVYVFAQSTSQCDIFYIYNVSYQQFLKKENEPNWPQIIRIVMGCFIPLLFILQMYQGTVFWKIGSSHGGVRSRHGSNSYAYSNNVPADHELSASPPPTPSFHSTTKLNP